MEAEERKKKLIKVSAIFLIVFTILFAVITTIVLNAKKRELDEINKKNDNIAPEIEILLKNN